MTIHRSQSSDGTGCSPTAESSSPSSAWRKGAWGGSTFREGPFADVKCFVCHTRRVGFSCPSSFVPVDVFAEYFRERFVRRVLLAGEAQEERGSPGKNDSGEHPEREHVCGGAAEQTFEREGTQESCSQGGPSSGAQERTVEKKNLSCHTLGKKANFSGGVGAEECSRLGKPKRARPGKPRHDDDPDDGTNCETAPENHTSAAEALGQKCKQGPSLGGPDSHLGRHPACLICPRHSPELCTGCSVCCPGPPPWFDLVLHPQPPLRIKPLTHGLIGCSAFSWRAVGAHKPGGEARGERVSAAREQTGLKEETQQGAEKGQDAKRGGTNKSATVLGRDTVDRYSGRQRSRTRSKARLFSMSRRVRARGGEPASRKRARFACEVSCGRAQKICRREDCSDGHLAERRGRALRGVSSSGGLDEGGFPVCNTYRAGVACDPGRDQVRDRDETGFSFYQWSEKHRARLKTKGAAYWLWRR